MDPMLLVAPGYAFVLLTSSSSCSARSAISLSRAVFEESIEVGWVSETSSSFSRSDVGGVTCAVLMVAADFRLRFLDGLAG